MLIGICRRVVAMRSACEIPRVKLSSLTAVGHISFGYVLRQKTFPDMVPTLSRGFRPGDLPAAKELFSLSVDLVRPIPAYLSNTALGSQRCIV